MTQINYDIFYSVLSILDAKQCMIFSITSKEYNKLVKDKYYNIYHKAKDIQISSSKIFNIIHLSELTLQHFNRLLENDISKNIIQNESKYNSIEKLNNTIELFKILNITATSEKIKNYIKDNICSYFENLYISRHSEEYLNNKIMIHIYALRVTDLFWYKSNINQFFLMENMILLLRKEYDKTKFDNFNDWYDNNLQNTISTCSYIINIVNITKNMVTKMYCNLVLYNYIIYVIKNKYYNDNIKMSFHFFIDRIKLFKDSINTINNKKLYFKKKILETFDEFEEIYKKDILVQTI